MMTRHAPSDDQWQVLYDLPARRGLLLQCHWLWAAGQPPAAALAAVQAALTGQAGMLLSRAKYDLLAIGVDSQPWSELWLLALPAPQALHELLLSDAWQALTQHAEQLNVLVASEPHPRLQRIIRIMNRILPWLPAPRRGRDLPAHELRGGINPTPAQLDAFYAADQSQPVHMFNLLKFHPEARYTDGSHGQSGRQAYEQGYGKVAMSCVLRLGGRVVALGRYRFTLIGAGGNPASSLWDEIAVIEYPRRPAFVHMLSNPGYIAALTHRHAGLARTLVWSAAPQAVGS